MHRAMIALTIIVAGILLWQQFSEFEEAVILFREALQADLDFWPGA